MKKWLNNEFKSKLAKEIADIEISSNTEIVVLIKEISGNYNDIYLIVGLLLSLISFTFFIFSPFVFGDYLIYMGTILSFFVGLSLAFIINPLSKLFINKQRMIRNVEIMSRASFQKGGIHHTLKKTGVLIYVSLFEKQVFLLADKGIINSIPKDEMETLENKFKNIFNQPDIDKEILKNLKELKEPFSKYIPSVIDDINELDDNMEIIL
jgi:putative membrane protein